jgi:hypothetical protein
MVGVPFGAALAEIAFANLSHYKFERRLGVASG